MTFNGNTQQVVVTEPSGADPAEMIHFVDILAKSLLDAGLGGRFYISDDEPTDETKVWVDVNTKPASYRRYNGTEWVAAGFYDVWDAPSFNTIQSSTEEQRATLRNNTKTAMAKLVDRAALKAFSGVENYVSTLYYAQAGDGGFAEWVSDNTVAHSPSEGNDYSVVVADDGRRWVRTSNIHFESPLGSPITDWGVIINAPLALGLELTFGSGTWDVATSIRYRRGGSISGGYIGDRYVGTAQNDNRPHTGTHFRWVGAAGEAVVTMSNLPIGQGYFDGTPDAFGDSIFSPSITGVTIDGNNSAGYGLYAYRAIDSYVAGVAVTNCNLAGLWGSALYSGTWERNLCFRNGGTGIAIGMGNLDFPSGTFTVAEVNGFRLLNNNCSANGNLGQFDDGEGTGTENARAGAGITINIHRCNTISGNTSELNDGVSMWVRFTSSSNYVETPYSELANSLPLSGQTAIDSGRSSRKWDLWLDGTVGAFGNTILSSTLAGGWIRLTGTEPSPGRFGQPLTFTGLALGAGLKSDWASYLLVNCDLNFSTNLEGVRPSGWAGSFNGRSTRSPDIIASGLFSDDGAGNITITDSFNVASVVRSSNVGQYVVTFNTHLQVGYRAPAETYVINRSATTFIREPSRLIIQVYGTSSSSNVWLNGECGFCATGQL